MMNQLYFLLLASSVALSGVVWHSDLVHDFGTVLPNEPYTHIFEFTNKTGAPISIDNVRTTCGCTAPSWSYDPIPQDSTNRIEIVYKGSHLGDFRKKIRVFFSHQRRPIVLEIEGLVEE